MKDIFKAEVQKISSKINSYKKNNKSIFATSSFQTQSVVLLHILMRTKVEIPVYFINTGYHFPETIIYKDKLRDLLGLHVIDLWPKISKSQQKDSSGRLLYTSDPDMCCYMNKVEPLENILRDNDVWISGVRRNQTEERKNMQEEEEGKFGTTLYRPLLDWTDSMIKDYIKAYDLPQHPLSPLSRVVSLGCEPCTKLSLQSDDWLSRIGRWAGLNKKECGLHTTLGGKK